MSIKTVYARTTWTPKTRAEALEEFRTMLDGFESEAMAEELELDYSTLRLNIELVDVGELTEEEEMTTMVHVMEAYIQGVGV